ncbi:MAG: hypothetical protein EOM30_04905 [Clostridia bacterium]|nr:hypothetical protein [Clostridia bacterium]NLS84264.1 hypothetical protein [Oscillospiraceae bacterium]
MANSAAYNLEDFADREYTPRQRLKVAEKSKKSLRINGKIVAAIMFAVIFVSLVCSVLYSQATVTELTNKIDNSEIELSELKSEYDYLNGQVEMKTALSSVEEKATALGLVKLDNSQITYVYRGNTDEIVRPDTTLDSIRNNIFGGLMSFTQFITP